jgi:AraC family transcriptional activator of mtrCDE
VLLDKLLSSLDVGVEPFSLCEVGPGRRLRLPGTPRATVHFVLDGCGFVRSAEGTAQALEPCSLAVVPRGMEHSLEPKDGILDECVVDPGAESTPTVPVIATEPGESPELTVACGFVRVRYGAALGLFDKLPEVLVEDLREIPQVRSAFRDILAEQSHAGPGSEAMMAALMSQCMVHLLRRLCASGTCSLPWLAALEDERLARALDRILRRPGDPHTVESLAQAASMSRSTFAAAFMLAFGMPPLGMVRRIRMERAWRLLEHSDGLSMETVASKVGFSSRSHFSRAFKSHFGISPATRRAMP